MGQFLVLIDITGWCWKKISKEGKKYMKETGVWVYIDMMACGWEGGTNYLCGSFG